MRPPYVTDAVLEDIVRRGLEEDLGAGDVTTAATIPADTRAKGTFLAKADGIVAGLGVAGLVFGTLDPGVSLSWDVDDGASVRSGDRFGRVDGSARAVLSAERLALNLLQRMSGIATATAAMVRAARPARVLDTRKTAPGLRLLDKWAVRLGGGSNHRIGLYDQLLIKDNHIVASGGIKEAIHRARRTRDGRVGEAALEIEIEVRTLKELDIVLETGGVDVILLDNMVTRAADGAPDVSLLREAVRRVGGRFRTEASGNVGLDTVAAIAATGVDAISSGSLTHSVQALDISLKVELVAG